MTKKNPYNSAMSKLHSDEILSRDEKSEIYKYLLHLESENNTLEHKVKILDETINEFVYTLKIHRMIK